MCATKAAGLIHCKTTGVCCHNCSSIVVPVSVDASEQMMAGTSAHEIALEQVFRLHYPRLVGLLARITGDRGRAEELAAEVFCRLSARPALFGQGTNLDGWLHRTAVNLGLDCLRMEARRRKNEQAAGVEMTRSVGANGPLDDLLRSEERTRVKSALAALKPSSAKLLVLRHAGMSYAQLAEALEIRPASVGKLLARATADFERRYRSLYGSEL